MTIAPDVNLVTTHLTRGGQVYVPRSLGNVKAYILESDERLGFGLTCIDGELSKKYIYVSAALALQVIPPGQTTLEVELRRVSPGVYEVVFEREYQ